MRFLPVLLLLACSPAVAAESIVGEWRPVDGTCSPTDGGIVVGPMSLAQDEVVCRFASVQRKGDVVTWKGRCEAAGEEPVEATMVARHHGGVLAVSRNGRQDESAYVRCR